MCLTEETPENINRWNSASKHIDANHRFTNILHWPNHVVIKKLVLMTIMWGISLVIPLIQKFIPKTEVLQYKWYSSKTVSVLICWWFRYKMLDPVVLSNSSQHNLPANNQIAIIIEDEIRWTYDDGIEMPSCFKNLWAPSRHSGDSSLSPKEPSNSLT